MTLLCDACGQAVPLTQLRQEAGALVFACAGCGVQGRIEMGGAAKAEDGEGGLKAAPSRGQETAPTGRVISAPVASAPTASAPTASAPTVTPAAATGAPATLTLVPGAPGPRPLFDPPADHCPKCIERHAPGALICARCGLAFANFTPELVRPRPELLDAWRELHARWEDPAAHERLLRLAEQWNALAGLGRLYRIRLAHAPDDVRAQEGRERIISRVASTVLEHAPAPMARKVSNRAIAYVMFAALVVGILGLLFRMVAR